MNSSKYLAFDYGAESGRAILGTLTSKGIELQEVHRFRNRQIKLFDSLYWDILYLFDELKTGLNKAALTGHKDLAGVGVDTWGVDFGFIDKQGNLIGYPYAYRDPRTNGMLEKAFQYLPKEQFYRLTGIQFIQLNSVFQLLSMVESKNPVLEIAEKLLFMPDIFNYFLTGRKVSEYSIASTSQLLNSFSRSWEPVVFEKLHLPLPIMPEIVPSGTILETILPQIASETGILQVDVIAPACHDTASAVAAVPAVRDNWAYLSSGTWSLLGIEAYAPIITNESLAGNFTNEGGVNNSIRFLRNTMGLWLLQRCLHQWNLQGTKLSYSDLVELAKKSPAFQSIIDPDDMAFLNPPDMPAAIAAYCQKTGQPVPDTKGAFVRAILESLALKYRHLIDILNNMRTIPIEVLHIVGGGSQNELLNQFTANATGLIIVAGPAEATALGNILVQAITKKELSGIKEGRKLIADTTSLKYYAPVGTESWNEIYDKFKKNY